MLKLVYSRVTVIFVALAFWGVGFLTANAYRSEPTPAPAVQHKCDESAARLIARIFNLTEAPAKVSTLSVPVTVSAYTARAIECDETPEVTADMTPSRVGILAVSPDMLSDGHVTYGDTVALIDCGEFLGVFVVHDTMNPRFTHRVDILHGNVKAALRFGIRHNVEMVRVIEDGSTF